MVPDDRERRVFGDLSRISAVLYCPLASLIPTTLANFPTLRLPRTYRL
jgi:hypothetical protein